VGKKWNSKEIGRLKMILEQERSHSVHEMARRAQQSIKNRSLQAISHKLRELISEQEWDYDTVEIDGNEYPAKLVSGYVVITLPDGNKKPLHHFIWEQEYGVIPEGYHIHHRDSNRTDNRLDNLALIDAGEHIQLHLDPNARPPETFALFCFLQEKGLWEEYLFFRDHILDEFPIPEK
jgi:hypothetical protein